MTVVNYINRSFFPLDALYFIPISLHHKFVEESLRLDEILLKFFYRKRIRVIFVHFLVSVESSVWESREQEFSNEKGNVSNPRGTVTTRGAFVMSIVTPRNTDVGTRWQPGSVWSIDRSIVGAQQHPRRGPAFGTRWRTATVRVDAIKTVLESRTALPAPYGGPLRSNTSASILSLHSSIEPTLFSFFSLHLPFICSLCTAVTCCVGMTCRARREFFFVPKS